MKNFHVVIPMSGQGTRYQAAGYKDPKPLIPVNGIPMIERLLSKMPLHWKYHFVLAENHRGTGLAELLKKLRPEAEMNFIGPHKEGPSYAIQSSLSKIPADESVLVSYCDYGLVWDPQHFENFVKSSECDSCLVSYRGFHAHYLNPQNYAFSRLEGERVVEVREKGNFTDNRENEFASCGAYYFRTRKILEDAVRFQMDKKLEIKGEYYTSLTVEALLQMNPQAHVRIFEIPGFFQWGTPQDLREYEYWEKTFQRLNKSIGCRNQMQPVQQVLMPMAGFGSRFQTLTTLPKPLIEFNRKPMYVQALETFPRAKKSVFVTRSEVKDLLKTTPENSDFVFLDYVPEGQALTTELGLEKLNSDQEVLVTACDHGVVIDEKKWNDFKSQNFDAAIFTVKGFPGVLRKPQSYSYVKTNGSEEFPRLDLVSVKKPVTDQPAQEHLLVGTFWFKNRELLAQGIEKLKQKNIRTNNEIYLDAVFNELQSMNCDIRIFELDGYMNWGDPDSLKEALYWQEIFLGHTLMPRPAFPDVQFGK